MVAKINRLISGFISTIVFALIIFSAGYVRAADMVLISDTETQDYLASVVKPLFQAAGVAFNKNKLLIVNDSSLNAFVADGNYLFVHTGTLLAAKNTNELAGILAHETGHIMGGHIVRQKLKCSVLFWLPVPRRFPPAEVMRPWLLSSAHKVLLLTVCCTTKFKKSAVLMKVPSNCYPKRINPQTDCCILCKKSANVTK